jgi:hypothetical protein
LKPSSADWTASIVSLLKLKLNTSAFYSHHGPPPPRKTRAHTFAPCERQNNSQELGFAL